MNFKSQGLVSQLRFISISYFARVNNETKAIKTTWISIIGNFCIAVIKWITGYFGNSYGLIADAIESTSDIFASLLALFGLTYAVRPPDENHPYGHGKAEPMISPRAGRKI